MQSLHTILDGGDRLDSYLTKQFSYSRNFWSHIIERGGITLETSQSPKILKKSYILKTGDHIYIAEISRFLDGGILSESPAITIDVKLETDDYLVIYKPKGVLSHPNSVRDVSLPNIVGGLYHHYKTLPSMANFIRAGLLHRLDKDTDGLMIIAKTEDALAYFKKLFQQKSGAVTKPEKEEVPLKKYYRATCDFTPQGRIYIDALPTDPDIYTYIESFIHPKVPHPGEAKRGITKVRSYIYASDQKNVTLDLEILTGRTHQIRYQLSELGLPIVGDYIYNAAFDEEAGISMQLTAYRLEFLDIYGKYTVVSL